jgi:protocatechuate 3,4-dioxygenase beta subunit
MEGPYYTPNPPQRTSLIEEGVVGEPILLTGYVWDTACRPIAGAVVDLWQTDGVGVYDNDGYRLRGYTLTDGSGRYTMQTVVPGEYPGRPPHIHVKIQPPGGAVLTSQMYFPNAAANVRDRLFDPALILDLQETGEGLIGVMNFVVMP